MGYCRSEDHISKKIYGLEFGVAYKFYENGWDGDVLANVLVISHLKFHI